MIHSATTQGSTESKALFGFGIEGKSNLPSAYKVGRELTLQTHAIEKSLFSKIEGTEKGGYIIRSMPTKFTSLEFKGFCMAVSQLLYNQSYQSGNTSTNSGTDTEIGDNATKALGATAYTGVLETTLNQLCKMTFGVDTPDSKQKKAISTLLQTLNNEYVIIQYPDGTILEEQLCSTQGKKTDPNKAISYRLVLNPIFTRGVVENYGLHPQDAMLRLTAATKKKTPAHISLLTLLGIQDKRKPFIRYKDQLLEDLDLLDSYRNKKSRTEKQIITIFEDLIKQGILQSYEIETTLFKGRDVWNKFIFHLNPDYAKI